MLETKSTTKPTSAGGFMRPLLMGIMLVHNDVECLLEAAYHYSKKVLNELKQQAVAC